MLLWTAAAWRKRKGRKKMHVVCLFIQHILHHHHILHPSGLQGAERGVTISTAASEVNTLTLAAPVQLSLLPEQKKEKVDASAL